MTDGRAKLRIGIAGAIIVLVAGWVAVKMATDSTALPVRDYIEYHSAGRVFLNGGNPYSGSELLEEQRRSLGKDDLDDAMMMWNPPWTLVIVAPFSLLSLGLAHKLWILGQAAAVFGSAWMLWKTYRGPAGKEWIGWVVAATFPPVLFLVWWGQIGGLVLLGLAGYLFHVTRGRYLLAGAFAALTAIKPHLLFAFGLVLVLDAIITRRGRIVLAGGAAVIAVLAAGAWMIHPDVYHLYRTAGWESSTSANVSPKDWIQPLISYWFRYAIDPDRFGLQFIPTILVAIGTVIYWFRKRKEWDWPTELPRLIFASVIAAAYGAWLFDLVVLLVPITYAAATLARTGNRRIAWRAGGVYAGIMVVAVLFPTFGAKAVLNVSVGLHYYIWIAPVLVLLCAYALTSARPYNASREPARRTSSWRTPTAAGTGS